MPKACNGVDVDSNGQGPTVSVLVITYNQKKFIDQALESVLEQTTDFDYEIVIGEDCSTDGTRDIVLNYRKKFPDIVRLRLNSANVGANRNFAQTLGDCHGRYIALLEGDDYWTSPLKLQKQVDYLDNRTDCAICFHGVASVDEHGDPIDEHKVPPPPKATSTLKDIVRSNFIHTCSVMFRSGLVSDFPDWYYTSKLGDWPLHVFNAQHGDIGYLDETMAAYRVHGGGMWSSASRAYTLQETIRLLGLIDAHLHFEYAEVVKASISRFLLELAVALAENGQWAIAARRAIEGVVRSPFTNIRTKCWCIKRLFELMLGFGK